MVEFFFSFLQATFIYIIIGKIIINDKKINLIESTLLGLIIFSFFSVLINFFFPLNQFTNTIVIITIIILFKIKKKIISRNDFVIFLLISLVSFFITIYDTVNRPDAYLYHFPYIQILNNEKIILGLSNLHFRFAHISIAQYLSASNYTYLTNQSSILSPIAIFWSLILFYYLNDIWKLINKNDDISIGKIFSVFILIYITYKINRYGEFGNDMMGHLTIFFIVSKFLYHKTSDKFNLFLICTLSVFAIVNKIFLAISIILPLYIVLKEKISFLKTIFNLPLILIIIWLLKNILISGCVIYPAKQLCFNNIIWTNLTQIEREAQSGEAWAKGWPQRNNKEITMKDFNKKFNWIEAWSKEHLQLILKTIIPYILIILISFIFTRTKMSENFYEKNKLILVLFFSFIGSFLFFSKFPLYRYGYSYLIIFIISIFTYLFFKYINKKKFLKFSKIVFFLCIAILISKQMYRVVKFYSFRDATPSINTDKNATKKFEKIFFNEDFHYYLSNTECMYDMFPCTNQKPTNLKFKKKYSYKILYN